MTSFVAIIVTCLTVVRSERSETCPPACTCHQIEGRPTTDCRHQSLTDVPVMYSGTMTLHLEGNNFGRLNRPSYFVDKKLQNLVSLSLKNCNISEIGRRTLESLSILETLDLSYNLLEELPDGTFSGLTRLKSIQLSHNFLTEINANTFFGVPLLKVVDLSHNRIRYILNDAFKELISLRKIFLQGNHLFHLEKTPFFRMQYLTILKLVNNPWRCDCFLRSFVKWQRDKYLTEPPKCWEPGAYRRKTWDQMTDDEFACAPKYYGNRADTKRTVNPGSNVTLACPLENGDPAPDVIWEFRPANSSEKQILTSQYGKVYFLKTVDTLKPNAWNFTVTIIRVSYEDEGRYHCVGRNKAGSEHEAFDLEILKAAVEEAPVLENGRNSVDFMSTADLWLVIVVLAAVLLIFVVLAVIGCYYRRSRSVHRAKNFKSVNGYGYQVIEGNQIQLEKTQQHFIEDCYLPSAGISYELPPPHTNKQTLTKIPDSYNVTSDMPQDDSGYLEAALDHLHHSPRVSVAQHRHSPSFQPPLPYYDTAKNTAAVSPRQKLKNGKAPLAQQERAENMKMPLRETAL